MERMDASSELDMEIDQVRAELAVMDARWSRSRRLRDRLTMLLSRRAVMRLGLSASAAA